MVLPLGSRKSAVFAAIIEAELARKVATETAERAAATAASASASTRTDALAEAAAPALTLGLAIQPEVLADVAAVPGFRGLLARIPYALPENTVGRRKLRRSRTSNGCA